MKYANRQPQSASHRAQSNQPFFSVKSGQAVQRESFFKPSGIVSAVQAKLTVGAVDDQYEQEADRVAAAVVDQIHSPSPEPAEAQQTVQRTGEEDELQMKPLQRMGAAGGEVSDDFESELNAARRGGQSLAPNLQAQMGQAMGADFSRVRVHTDRQADGLNRSVGARAFTTGQDVFFRQGAYQPGNRGGQELIAHELTHVMQQSQPGILQRDPYATETEEAKLFKKNAQDLTNPTRKQEELLNLNDFKQEEANRLHKTVNNLTDAEKRTAIANALAAFKESFKVQGKVSTAENQGGFYAGADEFNNVNRTTGIPMTFHHIIPRNLLRDFWNRVINNGDMKIFAPAVKGIIGETYKREPFDQSALEINGQKKTKQQLTNVVDRISAGNALRQTAQRDEQAIGGIIATMYQWMPGNIFHGPKNRVKPDDTHFTYIPDQDDGGDDFDQGAQYVLPTDKYKELYDTYLMIRKYGGMLSGKTIKREDKVKRNNLLEAIGGKLHEISKRTSVWPFDPEQWRIIADPTTGKKPAARDAYWRVRTKK